MNLGFTCIILLNSIVIFSITIYHPYISLPLYHQLVVYVHESFFLFAWSLDALNSR